MPKEHKNDKKGNDKSSGKKPKKAKDPKPKKPKDPKPGYPLVIYLPDGSIIVRGTVATVAPGPTPPGPNLTLRHANISIPAVLKNPTLNVNIYSLSQSPAFVLNNFKFTWDKKYTNVSVDFSNTRVDENGHPLPEPETNVFYCDYIIIG